MKKTQLFLIAIMLSGLCLSAFSQVRTPKLLFTEFAAPTSPSASYYELTNMEDTVLDLRDFTTSHYGWWLDWTTGNPTPDYHLSFSDYLDESNAYLNPGESFVVSTVYEGVYDDGTPVGRPVLNERSDLLIYANEAGNDDLAEGEDSISLDPNWMRGGTEGEGKALFYKSSPTDSVLIDAINNYIDPSTNKVIRDDPFDVAGVTDAVESHVLVRKANITQGSLTIYDWPTIAGNDPSESQWMVVPYDPTNTWNPAVFSSVGNHGVFDIVISSETVTIDETAGTITVPWGIRKGTWDVTNNRSQGIFNEITFGEGMAWNYEELGDTASSACQTGDILNVFAFGNELIHKSYEIIAEEAAAENALALPKRAFDYEYYNSWLHGAIDLSTDVEDRRLYQPYVITEDVPGMDTIGNLPYAVRVDSLTAYIELATDATYEIILVDGVERVDLKDGDLLRITAGDNSTIKDYYLSVNDITKSTNAYLSAITWPDVDKTEAELLGFNGDTIPGFRPTTFNYSITVPFGTSSVPALSYFKENLNSTVEVDRAVTLRGSREDRTTILTVKSQDTTQTDGVVNVYKITFDVEQPPEYLQPYSATPIISELGYRLNGLTTLIEIANVGNQPINLQNYLILSNVNNFTPAEAIANLAGADSATWRKRYTKYIPGLKHQTWEDWQSNPAVMKPDGNVNPIVEPGETFLMGMLHPNINTDPAVSFDQIDEVDIHWSSSIENANGEVGFTWQEAVTSTFQGNAIMVFKILNPDVINGNKPVTDPLDFELVDLFGAFAWDPWEAAGVTPTNNNSYTKKSHAWRPNVLQNGGFSDNAEDSDWIQRRVFTDGVTFGDLYNDIGNYSHDPITEYMSTVSSTSYIVDGGYQGDLNIVGVVTGQTVSDVFDNIIKADTGQNLSVISKTTGIALDSSVVVTNGDTLMVVSADEMNTTKYVLEVSEYGLDNNAVLTAKEGSGLTITTDGATGTIEGIPFGMAISEILDMVLKPELAVLNVIDGGNNLVPLQSLNPDTMMVQTRLLGEVYFEVVAQNQLDIITYELMLDISASDAWVESNVYSVDQEELLISLIPEGVTVEALMDNLIPSGNATIELLTKNEIKRDSGYVVLDDRIRVVSEDGSNSVDYLLWFLGTAAPERTEAFVTSEVYTVNEDQLVISNIPADTDVGTFLANLEPAVGATIKLVDASGNDKTTGTIVSGDKLVVTSEDGETISTYTLEVIVSTRDLMKESISIYPNPANNVLYLSGVPVGSTIDITSITGQKVKVLNVVMEPIELSIEDLEKGYYIISITDGWMNSTQFRFVKQ